MTSTMASVESQFEGINTLLRQILEGVRGVKADIRDVRSAMEKVAQGRAPHQGEGHHLERDAVPDVPLQLRAAAAAALVEHRAEAAVRHGVIQEQPAGLVPAAALADDVGVDQVPHHLEHEQGPRHAGARVAGRVADQAPELAGGRQGEPHEDDHREEQLGARKVFEEMPPRTLNTVAMIEREKAKAKAAMEAAEASQRIAEREAVAAVHLPGAPELAESAGHVVQLRLLQHPRHVRWRGLGDVDVLEGEVVFPHEEVERAGVRHVRRSHSGKAIKVKKDGAGGKGTWGKLIDTDTDACLDRNDPNYDSDEESYELVEAPVSVPLDDYKKSLVPIIEEYFSTGDVKLAASDLKELGYDEFHRHFVKKLVSMTMDRHDKEKEMVSVLLSSLYGDVVSSTQIRLGFVMLLEPTEYLLCSWIVPDARWPTRYRTALFCAKSSWHVGQRGTKVLLVTCWDPGDHRTQSTMLIVIVKALCCFSYIIDAGQKSGTGRGDSIALRVTRETDCTILPHMHFETHHSNGNARTSELEGLVYLHEQGVIHRDIKGANILTIKEGLVKLADFGVATKVTEADNNTHSVVGTAYWTAPEVIKMSDVCAASDIWSVGCTVIELITCAPPYYDLQPMPALFRIVQDVHPPIPEDLSPEITDFLQQCFQKDAMQRPDAKTLLMHPWLQNSRRALPSLRQPVQFWRNIGEDDEGSSGDNLSRLSGPSGDASFEDLFPIDKQGDHGAEASTSTTGQELQYNGRQNDLAKELKARMAQKLPDNDIGKNSFNYFKVKSAFSKAYSVLTDANFVASLEHNRAAFWYKKTRGVTGYHAGFVMPSPAFFPHVLGHPAKTNYSVETPDDKESVPEFSMVVDCIEGVCVQTETVLCQALDERIRPVPTVNKMDRCFLELQVEGEEAYQTFFRVIENANVSMATYEDKLLDDVQVYPEKGTVAFSAGLHGWAFTLISFAKMYASKFGVDESKMRKRLWGENFFDPAFRGAGQKVGLEIWSSK